MLLSHSYDSRVAMQIANREAESADMEDPFIADVAQAYANELRAQNAVDFDVHT